MEQKAGFDRVFGIKASAGAQVHQFLQHRKQFSIYANKKNDKWMIKSRLWTPEPIVVFSESAYGDGDGEEWGKSSTFFGMLFLSRSVLKSWQRTKKKHRMPMNGATEKNEREKLNFQWMVNWIDRRQQWQWLWWKIITSPWCIGNRKSGRERRRSEKFSIKTMMVSRCFLDRVTEMMRMEAGVRDKSTWIGNKKSFTQKLGFFARIFSLPSCWRRVR